MYATYCSRSELGVGCDVEKISVSSDDFKLLARDLAVSNSGVFYASGYAQVTKLSHLDPATTRIVYGTNSQYIADKDGVYRNINIKVEGVANPSSFKPVPSALNIEGCIYSPGYGEYYMCKWYKDDSFVYFEDKIIIGADVDSFEVISKFEARDKSRFYKDMGDNIIGVTNLQI